jgi:acetylornithine/N-succinyldiaminopimelate aminotransferase
LRRRRTRQILAINLGGEIGPTVVAEALRHGLLTNAPRRGSPRFMPALRVTPDEIDEMISTLDATLKQTRDARPA